jgi:hypothetical protein
MVSRAAAPAGGDVGDKAANCGKRTLEVAIPAAPMVPDVGARRPR